MIICTCGHKVSEIEDTETLNLRDYDPDFGGPAVATVSYCKECAQEAKEEGLVLKTEAEEIEWLRKW